MEFFAIVLFVGFVIVVMSLLYGFVQIRRRTGGNPFPNTPGDACATCDAHQAAYDALSPWEKVLGFPYYFIVSTYCSASGCRFRL